ncbi:progestin and adipoQ receptor family member 4 isoform X2 [Drosophila grimshawi]|uniref:progestin and adipoQ receptor family member 4 isoform X2 n=1 Tax=Drosophila grimshawi TaxID=7222 RepID=UPI001C933E74|nr:progestin and adipoQ receptor family member 4 isoform X2 [Drosophila grimshawi]
MDTAAAAAAAVVVDLSAEAAKSTASKLISKSKLKPLPQPLTYAAAAVVAATATSADIANCLGSNVESMLATPPPTPARTLHGVHGNCNETVDGININITSSNSSDSHAMNLLKDAAGGDSGHSECILAPALEPLISTTTLTSSTNASTTPTSALLTAPLTATTTATTTTSTATTTTINALTTATGIAAGTAASAATTTTTTGTNGSSGTTGRSTVTELDELLHWQDMPKYLQFNPYVLKGYRPLQTFKGCLLSLFYWHNETINILTHAIPIFYILAIVPGLMPWDSGYKFLSFCHVFGSVAPWCGSFVYHLFMNIEKGENVYYKLLKLDMVGIWVSQSFGALPLVTATTLCFPPILKWFIIISYCLLSLWGLYKALTASSPWQRRLCFALPFAMRSVLTFLRIRGMVGGSHMALSHVYLQDGVSILGGAIGAMRIPEKWFPGLVDFYLNSHNIMHVLVVVAVYSMHKATIKDFEWMSTQTCNSMVNVTEHSLGHLDL